MATYHSEISVFLDGSKKAEYEHHLVQPSDEHAELQDEHGRGNQQHAVQTKMMMMDAEGSDTRQSPINIDQSETVFDESLEKSVFKVHYNPQDCRSFTNTGHSWQIDLASDSDSHMNAEHLNGVYRLHQIHCHWSTDSTNGSEHTVDGRGYAGEIHLVHYKKEYGSFENAVKCPDGLAVLGIFLNESHDDNPALDEVVQLMERIRYKGQQVQLARFNAKTLLPSGKHEFWTYVGSLTTPPYTQCVLWTVFRSSLPISSRQLEKLRTLCTTSRDESVHANNDERKLSLLLHNSRNVQPLNGRLIKSSFARNNVVDE